LLDEQRDALPRFDMPFVEVDLLYTTAMRRRHLQVDAAREICRQVVLAVDAECVLSHTPHCIGARHAAQAATRNSL
jgi:hypothetical protein